ncbi:MAG: hypothetical protein J0L84_00005 [Verrucomicrobia bacterium]|nr:hypothetical protein [Verrucomicrobiota bacterium]
MRLTLLLGFACRAAGQFYAPETTFHDVVQRRYPVECVRVMLAWQEARSGQSARPQTVGFRLDATDATHRWTLKITGESADVLRSVTLDYPNSLLCLGPKFFRETAAQAARQLQIRAVPEAGFLSDAYWSGAARSHPSRESSLTNAFAISDGLTATNPVSTAIQLAGLLAHACPPPQAGRVTLDGLLLARAAAWLALAEIVSGNTEDAFWTPLLYQSGRGPGADAAWQGRPEAWTNQPLVRVWDVRMSRPNTQATFLAACDTPSASLAAALLFANAADEHTWPLLEDVLPMIFRSKASQRALHNYAPIAASRGSVGMGHQFSFGALAQRLAWMDLLQQRSASAEFAPFREGVTSCAQALQKLSRGRNSEDTALAGLEEMAPLYRLAEELSAGPLRETTVATCGDLAGYGWEMAGWQLGVRHRFLNERYGSREDARPVKTASLRALETWSPFFEASREGDETRQQAMNRLQYVTETMRFAGQKIPPFHGAGGAADPAATARRFVSACWLEPLHVPRYSALLGNGGVSSEIAPTLERLLEEGGFLESAPLLTYLAGRNLAQMKKSHPELLPLRERVAAAAPQPNLNTFEVLQSGEPRRPRDLAWAQDAERLYWKNTDSGLEETVFDAYALSGFPGEARRFYFRVRAHLGDPVKVSNNIGEKAWLLGLALDDPKLRKAALADGASGSASDLQTQAWDAAARGDVEAFSNAVRGRLERYPDTSGRYRWERILQFAELVPALAKPDHPDRQKALDYFGRDADATMLRWIWIQRYRLPPGDAIRFLGGRDPDAVRKVFVRVLENDLPAANAAVAELQQSPAGRGAYALVAIHARNRLLGAPQELTPDLMPPGARFTRDLVRERTDKGP